MAEALTAPRGDISAYAPRILTMKIKVDKIRDVIGSGGKTIRSIIEQTGCKIEVQDDGTINIASVDENSAKRAMAIIKELTAEAEIGKIYQGRVKRVMDFGAFVEIFAGTEGLVPRLAARRAPRQQHPRRGQGRRRDAGQGHRHRPRRQDQAQPQGGDARPGRGRGQGPRGRLGGAVRPPGASRAGPQVFGRTLLPSGVRVVTEELAGRPTVSLGVWVGSGSRVERAGLEGGAHFIEHLLFKGTKKRTAAALAKEIDAIGGHLDAFTSREYTAFYLNLLVDHLERGMEILADILLHSTFPANEVERERRVILEEIRSAEDNPEDCAYELLVQGLWGGSPLGRPILGGPESVGEGPARPAAGVLRRQLPLRATSSSRRPAASTHDAARAALAPLLPLPEARAPPGAPDGAAGEARLLQPAARPGADLPQLRLRRASSRTTPTATRCTCSTRSSAGA